MPNVNSKKNKILAKKWEERKKQAQIQQQD
jgi:hypothetical protein